MLDRICGYIYRVLLCRKGRNPDKSIVKKLVFLHPSEDIEKLYGDFCIKRIKVTLVTVLAGLILGCFMKLSSVTGRGIPGTGFERNEWNGKKEHLELYAISGEERLPVDVILEPRLILLMLGGCLVLNIYASGPASLTGVIIPLRPR